MKVDMWAVTGLDDKIVKKAMFSPKESIQQTINDALRITQEKNKTARVVIMPQGSLVVPLLE